MPAQIFAVVAATMLCLCQRHTHDHQDQCDDTDEWLPPDEGHASLALAHAHTSPSPAFDRPLIANYAGRRLDAAFYASIWCTYPSSQSAIERALQVYSSPTFRPHPLIPPYFHACPSLSTPTRSSLDVTTQTITPHRPKQRPPPPKPKPTSKPNSPRPPATPRSRACDEHCCTERRCGEDGGSGIDKAIPARAHDLSLLKLGLRIYAAIPSLSRNAVALRCSAVLTALTENLKYTGLAAVRALYRSTGNILENNGSWDAGILTGYARRFRCWAVGLSTPGYSRSASQEPTDPRFSVWKFASLLLASSLVPSWHSLYRCLPFYSAFPFGVYLSLACLLSYSLLGFWSPFPLDLISGTPVV
ncbi:hypothetical protein K438DRAFT_1786879 [Mycena galopus ATCC 62051]|nr:hypothetical protein K438DRAFT_1786879 [Mycena galopus ATCC 62051]